MRLLGALCVFLAGASAGLAASGRLRRQAAHTERLAALLGDCAACIRYQCLPLGELLAAMAQRQDYAAFSFLHRVSSSLEPGVPPTALWCRAVREDSAVPPDAADILCSLGEVLGTTDLQGQLAALRLHEMQLRQAAEQQQALYRGKGGMYRWLGMLGGAMLVLLIL